MFSTRPNGRTVRAIITLQRRWRRKKLLPNFTERTHEELNTPKCRNASSATEDWLFRVRGVCLSADGSVVRDDEYVYVLPLRQIRQIDYFHGTLPGQGPVAQMVIDDGPDILASEMFSTRPDGRTVRAIITLQRRWRRKKLLHNFMERTHEELTALILQREPKRRKENCM